MREVENTSFSSLIVHGFTPNDFNEATIFPLIKNKRKSVSDSTNYRAIALSSLLAKLFDKIILHKYSDAFTTGDMQFCFKEHSSTTKCTFALGAATRHDSLVRILPIALYIGQS